MMSKNLAVSLGHWHTILEFTSKKESFKWRGFSTHAPSCYNAPMPHTWWKKKITGKKSVPRGDPQRFSQKFLHPDLAFSSARVGKPQPKIAAVRLHRNSKKEKNGKNAWSNILQGLCFKCVFVCVCLWIFPWSSEKKKKVGGMTEVSEVGTLSPLGIPNFQRSQWRCGHRRQTHRWSSFRWTNPGFEGWCFQWEQLQSGVLSGVET